MDLKKIFEKSLAVNKTLNKGSVITIDDLEAKKPTGYGIPAKKFAAVVGKKLKSDLSQWDFLNWENIELE